ncbi:MAG: redoxin domain-containing protein [Acidimicrobiales bacterium]
MDCSSAREAISALLDQEPPGVPLASLEGHLASCGACRSWQQRAHEMMPRVRLQAAQVSPPVPARLLDAMARHLPRHGAPNPARVLDGPEAQPTAPPGQGQQPVGATGSRWRRPLVFATLPALVVALLAIVLLPKAGNGATATNETSFVSGPAANILQLDVLARNNRYMPANFQLTDQYGKPASLEQFRGKAVVLSFNDDQCTDLCTLLAQDTVAANQDMGPAAKHVVFLSVNVNPFYPQVRYVKAWTDSHGLGGQPNWVYTTGPVKYLKSVWKRYGTYVGLDYQTRTVVHGTDLYFINPAGHVVGVGQFGDNAADTSLYSHAMAQMAVDLLPAPERGPVGGPSVPAPTETNATIGAPAPAFSLPMLASPSRALSSSTLRGKYTVLNFWASTCTACTEEMPNIEKAYRDLGKEVAFVGVDVSDRRGAAAAFVKRAGVTYPLVSDTAGTLLGAYRAPGLPFTAIIGPHSHVLVRHPGALDTEQLEYVVTNEESLSG